MAQVVRMVKELGPAPDPIVVPGVQLRTFCGPSDIRRWLGLRQRSGLWELSAAGRVWTEGDFRREFIHQSWWCPERMWLAEETAGQQPRGESSSQSMSALVGSVTLGMRAAATSPCPVVHWLLVDRRWRRRGVGRWLLGTLEQECRRVGHRQLHLETLTCWTEAMAFYDALGFVREV